MDTISACPRGHRYRVTLLQPGRLTMCPRCDRVALVALAYGDCQNPARGCRLLNFKTEAVTDFQEFCELLSLVGPQYNAFRPTRVIHEIRPLFPKLMSVEIGREGSPAIYAHVPYWRNQAIEWASSGVNERIPDHERSDLSSQFLEAMRNAAADEASDEGYALRAWWD